MNSRKTIFITGVSSGFGNALAKEALAAGHRVIGTVRSEAALQAFQALDVDDVHGVILDVTDFDRIAAS
jgi:NADP-dependent 3-hydroxy acid dehydrogenase YdfG